MTDSFKTTLLQGAEKLKITLSDEQSEKLFNFYQTVVEYNEKVNLTSVTDEKEFIVKHILDSLYATRYIGKDAAVADVGAGAGFPSVPLKILRPDLSFTLLEATGKKVDFVNYAVKRLGLENISAVHIRAEEAGVKAYRASFDCVVSRAVGKINVLLEYGVPLLKKGGYLICYKGPDLSDADAETAGKKLYSKKVGTFSYQLPYDMGDRNLVVYYKIGDTPFIYPRTAAAIAKKPL